MGLEHETLRQRSAATEQRLRQHAERGSPPVAKAADDWPVELAEDTLMLDTRPGGRT